MDGDGEAAFDRRLEDGVVRRGADGLVIAAVLGVDTDEAGVIADPLDLVGAGLREPSAEMSAANA